MIALSGLPRALVVWNTEPVPFIGIRAGQRNGLMTLRITSSVGYGNSDDYRPSDDQSTMCISGLRKYTVTVMLELLGDATDLISAHDMLARIRTRMSRPNKLDDLRVVGLALIDQPTLTTIDMATDDRARSVAVMEIVWALAVNDTDTDYAPGIIELGNIAGVPHA